MNLDDLIAGLERRLNSFGTSRDVKPSQLSEWWTKYNETQVHITGLKNAPSDLARAQSRLDDALAQQTATEQKEAQLKALLADDEDGYITRQLQLLAEGRLLAAPGVIFWAPDHATERVRELTRRRDRAQLALDELVREAEQLLGETVSS